MATYDFDPNLRARFAALTRHRGPDHPETLAASAEIYVQAAERALRECWALPLTAGQRHRLLQSATGQAS